MFYQGFVALSYLNYFVYKLPALCPGNQLKLNRINGTRNQILRFVTFLQCTAVSMSLNFLKQEKQRGLHYITLLLHYKL